MLHNFRCSWNHRPNRVRSPWWRPELHAWMGAQLPVLVLRPGLRGRHLPVHRRRPVHRGGQDHVQVASGHGEASPYGAARLRFLFENLTSLNVLTILMFSKKSLCFNIFSRCRKITQFFFVSQSVSVPYSAFKVSIKLPIKMHWINIE